MAGRERADRVRAVQVGRQWAGAADLRFIDCGLQEIRGRDKAETVHRLIVPEV